MPNKITKTEIRESLSEAIQATASKYGVSPLSKKQAKAIESFSRKLAVDIKDVLKKKLVKEQRAEASSRKSRKTATTAVG